MTSLTATPFLVVFAVGSRSPLTVAMPHTTHQCLQDEKMVSEHGSPNIHRMFCCWCCRFQAPSPPRPFGGGATSMTSLTATPFLVVFAVGSRSPLTVAMPHTTHQCLQDEKMVSEHGSPNIYIYIYIYTYTSSIYNKKTYIYMSLYKNIFENKSPPSGKPSRWPRNLQDSCLWGP